MPDNSWREKVWNILVKTSSRTEAEDELAPLIESLLTERTRQDRDRIADYVNELGESQGWTIEVMAGLMAIIYDNTLTSRFLDQEVGGKE